MACAHRCHTGSALLPFSGTSTYVTPNWITCSPKSRRYTYRAAAVFVRWMSAEASVRATGIGNSVGQFGSWQLRWSAAGFVAGCDRSLPNGRQASPYGPRSRTDGVMLAPHTDCRNTLTTSPYHHIQDSNATFDRHGITGANFYRSQFAYADLEGSTIEYSTLEKANLDGTNLNGTRFSDDVMSGCDLSRVSLVRGLIIETDISNCNLLRTNSKDAELRNSNLKGTASIDQNLPHRHSIFPQQNLTTFSTTPTTIWL
ncbi:pentapeptide repeat-containing protein [Nocardia sp. NPDC005998]|uniref:pentapeptide repeat-containing protein n=1 Tax=Nocardia sp. NPDC005998 TaxID=3156894 RepID=UPI0033A224C0